MALSQVVASIRPGSLIAGRYRVEGALGKGGMGSVYAVSDLSTGQRLALKCLRRDAAAENGPAAMLFRREYHTLAHLTHPRVVQVKDYGWDGVRPYYTMELLDGSDLRELAPLPWRRACQVLRDVASSLALLHSRRLLHRDLSPRNVRCTRDGQAKLIDFGTMTPMGIARDVAGTAPYMAPEGVHGQALDARTDLYALGALAYWTLTGHDAYPARDTRELRELWPRAILPPSAIRRDVPESLDALVMTLLSLDPQARPGHAAEVIERLSAIAGLDPLDSMAVARAYLTSPTLVGHDGSIASFHKRLVRAARGRGSAVLVRGAAGVGRSRLLQAFVLEAKLGGTLVLTADAEDAQRGELGVARTLVEGLVEAAPDVAVQAFAEHAGILGATFPAIYERLRNPPPLVPPEGRHEQLAKILSSIRDFVIGVSQRRSLMIAVDDADHADEWSQACLALLAGAADSERLVVAASVEQESGQRALEVFATAAASVVELQPLPADQTLRLLRSVFGDVPHLQRVTDWVQSLAQGYPRTVMELAQYLVDHDIARHERGSWTLPESLRDQSLPKSVEQAIEEVVRSLSPAARALAEGLSLITDQGHLELGELERLAGLEGLEGGDQVYACLDELTAANVVLTSGSTYYLRQRGLSAALQRGLGDGQRRDLHLRLAELYRTRPSLGPDLQLLVAYHRYLGGDVDGCFDFLESLRGADEEAFSRTREAIAMFEACLAHGTAQGYSPARLFPIRKTLLRLSATADPALIAHAQPLLAQLLLDSGRARYDELKDVPDPLARIRRAVAHARSRYQGLPSAERGLDPVEAIYELGAAAMTLVASYVVQNDREALARLPGLLAPFRPMLPTFDLLHELTRQALDGLDGHDLWERRQRTLSRLEMPFPELEGSNLLALRSALTHWLGMDEAALGKESALERAAWLERQPLYAPLGAQVRSVYHLFAGNESEAESWQRRRELIALQSPYTDLASTQGILYEAAGYYLCGSVLGTRRVLGRVRDLASRHPGWKAHLRTVEGMYALLRGEPAAALVLFEGGIPDAAHAQALLAVGNARASLRAAEAAVQRSERGRDHPAQLLRLRAALALARSATGDHATAARELDADIERAELGGVGGMLLCGMLEARARIAIEMDDRAAFQRCTHKLRATYGRGTSALRARYEQLAVAARRALLSVPPAAWSLRPERVSEPSSDVHTQLEPTLTREQRLARALELLAKQARSNAGFLYALEPAGLVLRATLGEGRAPEGIEDMLAVYMSAELSSTQTVPHTVTGTFSATPDMVAWINDGQHFYYPVLLSCRDGDRRLVGGVAVLALPVQREPRMPAALIADIARSLLDAGDVTCAEGAD